jgi:hypothetical protein
MADVPGTESTITSSEEEIEEESDLIDEEGVPVEDEMEVEGMDSGEEDMEMVALQAGDPGDAPEESSSVLRSSASLIASVGKKGVEVGGKAAKKGAKAGGSAIKSVRGTSKTEGDEMDIEAEGTTETKRGVLKGSLGVISSAGKKAAAVGKDVGGKAAKTTVKAGKKGAAVGKEVGGKAAHKTVDVSKKAAKKGKEAGTKTADKTLDATAAATKKAKGAKKGSGKKDEG